MNLENLDVQELNTEEMKTIDGGLNAEFENDGFSSLESWFIDKITNP
jgi:bacteriocin-like protein